MYGPYLVAYVAATGASTQERWSALSTEPMRDRHEDMKMDIWQRDPDAQHKRDLREQAAERRMAVEPLAVDETELDLPPANDPLAVPKRRAEVHPDGSLAMSVMQTASGMSGRSRNSADDNEAELPESEGAPKDSYEKCAAAGDMCSCEQGEVRFGSVKSGSALGRGHLFTHPVMLGDNTEVQCSLDKLSDVALALPAEAGGAEQGACFCNTRLVHVQVELGTTSFVELDERDDDETTTDVGHLCMTPGTATSLAERGAPRTTQEAQILALSQTLEKATALSGDDFPVALENCETAADEKKDFAYLLSTGQIKHVDSGTCLTAEFDLALTPKQVTLKPCTLLDSQEVTQRWEVPFYLAPDFLTGKGSIKLAYGSHGEHGLCLNNDGHHLVLEHCDQEGTTEWTMSSVGGAKHQWAQCAVEGAACSCAGEVKYGYSDTKHYSQPISMQGAGSGSITCDTDTLASSILWTPDAESLDGYECQCRHDPVFDGEGDSAGTGHIASTNVASGNSSTMLGGGAIGFLAVAGLAFFMWKKKQSAYYAEFEEEEEEFEEEDEEYE